MSQPKPPPPGSRRMPSHSLFYDRLVPVFLALMTIVLIVVLAVAVAAVAGWIHF